jgi:hypothetical protein
MIRHEQDFIRIRRTQLPGNSILYPAGNLAESNQSKTAPAVRGYRTLDILIGFSVGADGDRASSIRQLRSAREPPPPWAATKSAAFCTKRPRPPYASTGHWIF